jgi:hypothetical protein
MLQFAEGFGTLWAFSEDAWLHFDSNVLELVLEVGHRVFSPGVIPDDSMTQGLPCLATPSNSCFTLVSDS